MERAGSGACANLRFHLPPPPARAGVAHARRRSRTSTSTLGARNDRSRGGCGSSGGRCGARRSYRLPHPHSLNARQADAPWTAPSMHLAEKASPPRARPAPTSRPLSGACGVPGPGRRPQPRLLTRLLTLAQLRGASPCAMACLLPLYFSTRRPGGRAAASDAASLSSGSSRCRRLRAAARRCWPRYVSLQQCRRHRRRRPGDCGTVLRSRGGPSGCRAVVWPRHRRSAARGGTEGRRMVERVRTFTVEHLELRQPLHACPSLLPLRRRLQAQCCRARPLGGSAHERRWAVGRGALERAGPCAYARASSFDGGRG